ncbi:1,6-anhydro-N-acetylmuramyl-L-alanine amidase AmpD [Psychromonas sp. 14N.309.X.WAT.B.A12]|uniref:1,6-anhydro-N-acetylmuramyl-L-alanine amidase AmpD n=1 Tax=unclassified Psychromonas TaxID=2614957 RepID=UPI0025B0EA65|nr:1,6-anhydro-N-acetylmuramyl-L-alanine amidase AmpD [Psychromonas sp. 14N.309.X.WAT.B.A12]MDN2662917.1 1,6-anhydro-N-acetylmuramyl-L-alanine amidase AmpD [Psychromonas sp. 14N.309.X.WAT.B.A12]
MTGLLQDAEFIKSPFFNERPVNTDISLLVIHCISLPEGQFGTEHVKNLFTGELNCKAHPSFACLEGLEVSAHCVIRRDGKVEQYVPFDKRAWHAGISRFDGVEGCNDFSIGIELEGTDCTAYSEAQYRSLVQVTQQIQQKYPLITQQRIAAHSDIAPGRKTDPGSEFDWQYYFKLLK